MNIRGWSIAFLLALAGVYWTAPAWAETFEASPPEGPRGTRIYLKGICKEPGGEKGERANASISRDADHFVVTADDFSVGSGGNWRGRITVPRVDPNGAPVVPGPYTISADCEFDEDLDADYSYADQPFTVTPGEVPDRDPAEMQGCDPSLAACTTKSVDCVTEPAACNDSFKKAEAEADAQSRARAKEAAAAGQKPQASASASSGAAQAEDGSAAEEAKSGAANREKGESFAEKILGGKGASTPSRIVRVLAVLAILAAAGGSGYLLFQKRRNALS